MSETKTKLIVPKMKVCRWSVEGIMTLHPYQQLDALRAETQKLEAIYQQKINDLEELKKSILAKAFAGEFRSPEGAIYTNDGYSPSDKKKKSIISPEGV